MYVCLQDVEISGVEILRNSILTIETVFLISLEPTISLGWQMESGGLLVWGLDEPHQVWNLYIASDNLTAFLKPFTDWTISPALLS